MHIIKNKNLPVCVVLLLAVYMVYVQSPARADTKEAQAFHEKGLAFDYKGESNKALEFYSKAIEANENYAEAYNNRGHVYLMLTEFDKALDDFNMAIKINPNSETYKNRGIVHHYNNDHGKAIADYTRAIEKDGYSIQSYILRGKSYDVIGEKEKAAKDFVTAKLMEKEEKEQQKK